MKNETSKPVGDRWGLSCFGLLLFIGVMVSGLDAFSEWRLERQLETGGLSTPTVIDRVAEVMGQKGIVFYKVHYSFELPGQSERRDMVVLNPAQTTALLGIPPDNYRERTRSGVVRYLPEAPSHYRLEGAEPASSVFFYFLFLGVVAGIGVALMVTGLYLSLPDPPLSALPSKESLLEAGRRVRLGNLTYTTHPERVVFQPSGLLSVNVLLLKGGIGLLLGVVTLFFMAWAFNVMFGWEFPGFLTTAGASGQSDPPATIGLLILGISLLPGILTTLCAIMVLQLLCFWRHPTVFDSAKGVFQCGGQEVCRLSDIREVCLRRIINPNYPAMAKIGLAVVLKDGSLHCLEPRFAFLSRFGNDAKNPFTELGELWEGYQQESVRRVAGAIAASLGVPLKERQEWGSLPVSRSGGK